MPNTERDDPMRIKVRNDSEEPIEHMSSSDRDEPSRVMP